MSSSSSSPKTFPKSKKLSRKQRNKANRKTPSTSQRSLPENKNVNISQKQSGKPKKRNNRGRPSKVLLMHLSGSNRCFHQFCDGQMHDGSDCRCECHYEDGDKTNPDSYRSVFCSPHYHDGHKDCDNDRCRCECHHNVSDIRYIAPFHDRELDDDNHSHKSHMHPRVSSETRLFYFPYHGEKNVPGVDSDHNDDYDSDSDYDSDNRDDDCCMCISCSIISQYKDYPSVKEFD